MREPETIIFTTVARTNSLLVLVMVALAAFNDYDVKGILLIYKRASIGVKAK